MDIRSVLGGLGQIGIFGKRGESPAPAEEPAAAVQSPVALQGQTAAFRDIVSRYDVTQISPREFAELVEQLGRSRLLTEGELHELALIRLELDQAGIDPDAPLDLVDFFADKLRDQEQELARLEEAEPRLDASRQESLGGTLRQLDWIKKFALIQTSAREGAMDAVA